MATETKKPQGSERDINEPNIKSWICPRCGKETNDFPAISRRDNTTEIYSACGLEEAMIDFYLDGGA